MFPIYDSTNVRVPLTWDGTYIFNTGSDPSSIVEVDQFVVRDMFNGTVEPYAIRNGFEAYRIHHNSKIIRIGGVIRGATKASALDTFNTLAGRFDPNQLYVDDPLSGGFTTLQWTDGGLLNTYEARPLQSPDLMNTIYQGANVPYSLDLLAKPWRGQNLVSSTVASGATLTNSGDITGYPVISVTLAAAGPATWLISNSRATNFISLNLSSLSSGTVIVNMGNRTVTHNGSPIMHLVTFWDWWGLYPGDNVITLSGGSLTSATFDRYTSYWSK